MEDYIDIVFDGGPGPEAGRLVGVEKPGHGSITLGTWVKRDDLRCWVLRVTKPDFQKVLP